MSVGILSSEHDFDGLSLMIFSSSIGFDGSSSANWVEHVILILSGHFTLIFQDPMNLGAILRSAYYLGVDRVIASRHNW